MVFFQTFPDVARAIARRGDVVMAHFEGAPDLFVGWIAYDRAHPNRLHYVYVKQNYRRQGVAGQLLSDHLRGDVQTSLNPSHAWKRDKAKALGYRHNPYQLMIGDTNGNNQTP